MENYPYIRKYKDEDGHVAYRYRCYSCGLPYKTRAMVRKKPLCVKCYGYIANIQYAELKKNQAIEQGRQQAFREVINHYVSEDYAEFENWLLKQIEVEE